MKKYNLIFFILFGLSQIACTQIPEDRPHCADSVFDEKVSTTISFTVPTIGVEELKEIQDEVYIFDTRKKEEYDLSHIEGARYLGYEDFDQQKLEGLPKNSKIVLYCSIGYRSEKIGEKLQDLGYTNVHNLYGSIFDWVNRGNEVIGKDGQATKKIHTYNRNWSRWVLNKEIEKIW